MNTTAMPMPDPDGWRVPDTVPELIAEAGPETCAAATRADGVDEAVGAEARAAYAAHLDAPQVEPAGTREPATGSADAPGAAAADESAASTHERSLEPAATDGPVAGERLGESLP